MFFLIFVLLAGGASIYSAVVKSPQTIQTIEEAEELTSTDPAIQAGSLIMELKPWYGSASIMQINDLHKKIARINI